MKGQNGQLLISIMVWSRNLILIGSQASRGEKDQLSHEYKIRWAASLYSKVDFWHQFKYIKIHWLLLWMICTNIKCTKQNWSIKHFFPFFLEQWRPYALSPDEPSTNSSFEAPLPSGCILRGNEWMKLSVKPQRSLEGKVLQYCRISSVLPNTGFVTDLPGPSSASMMLM